jgi:hypothetical protein
MTTQSKVARYLELKAELDALEAELREENQVCLQCRQVSPNLQPYTVKGSNYQNLPTCPACIARSEENLKSYPR